MFRILLIVSLLFLGSCYSYVVSPEEQDIKRNVSFENYKKFIHTEDGKSYIAGPNVIKLDSNLYLDETEVSNIGWGEFLYFTGKIDENLLPDLQPERDVWKVKYLYTETDTIAISQYSRQYMLDHYYDRSPIQEFYHDDYPVVGIDHYQMWNFSIWRTEAVFQAFLVESGVANPSKYLLNYSIPALMDYLFSDEPDYKTAKVIPFYQPVEVKDLALIDRLAERDSTIHSAENSIKRLVSENKLGPVSCREPKKPSNRYTFWNLQGNVKEMLAEENECFGGGWKDPAAECDFKVRPCNYPASDVGFRNKLIWVSYKQYKATIDSLIRYDIL